MERHEEALGTIAGSAEMLAIQALAFIAEEPERLNGFLSVTGTSAGATSAKPRASPDFLAGVLEHMLGDESLLLAFAESAGIDPAGHRPGPRRARRASGSAS